MPGVAQRYWTASTLQGKRWFMEKRLEAVELNDLAQLQQLLAAQSRPKPKELTAALEIAIMKRSDEYANCIQLLLQHGANSNGSNGSGTPFLHLAADADCQQIVSLLIKSKCDVNICREDGACALHKSAWQGNIASVRMLLNAGASVTTRDAMGRTPLLVAAQENKIAVCNILLAAGCSVNICDAHNRSVLYWAVYHRNPALVKEVISPDGIAVLNKQGPDGVTPLILAAHTGHNDILQLIIDAGAKPNIQDDNGMTAIIVAARRDNCVRMLIAAGCDVNTHDAYGKTPLMLLLDHDDLVKILLDAGADPNVSAYQQMTCLWLATSHKFVTSTKLLLQYNVRVDIRSGIDGNKLPLQTAMYGGCLSLVKMLFVTCIATATDLGWLDQYMKDGNLRDQASTNPEVAAVTYWINDVMDDFYKPREPLTLKAFCRIQIRRHLGSRRLWLMVDSLVLPGALKNYLKLCELDQYIKLE